jgi:hypothetical protein
MSINEKAVLTEKELMDRWGVESPKVIARHRTRGLRGFRVAHKARGTDPGQSLWRYHLRDVEAYEEQLKDESAPKPETQTVPVAASPAAAGWDGVSRVRGPWAKRRRSGG